MTEHVDVLIVGAGLSGIGAAATLAREHPGRRYAILEARDAIGGTWDLFRYPGVRSDSDMQTLGYRFRPWTGEASIADGPSILDYVRDTARESGVDRHVRLGHRVLAADWSSEHLRWTVRAEHDGEPVVFTADFLMMCSGYYRYDRGHAPEFPGIADFRGRVVHPQFWPEDLDHTGSRVVVIGSGATAVTLVPSMAATAAHVTMLQRSPTYIAKVPARDALDLRLRRLVGTRAAYVAIRWKNVLAGMAQYTASKRFPRLMKRMIVADAAARLPEGYDVDTHFSPDYGPWDQRFCAAPDGDFFAAIRAGTTEVVTDRIDTFTPTGIRLASGRELDADLVVTATGLELLFLGGAALSVDGTAIDPGREFVYRSSMLSGVPNLAFTVGYTNASWTLRADLVSGFVSRLLAHMDARGHRVCVPPHPGPEVTRTPLLDLDSGYVRRGAHLMPTGGSRGPWRMGHNYLTDVRGMRHGRIDDGVLRFGGPVPAGPRPIPADGPATAGSASGPTVPPGGAYSQ
ncbi:flavin-containing monooxygenase [Pseudonocardia alni]|uniref:flavin-containing monooxygenase n=1 Tax=Pseudonocardia alni TaxID=33907 RepID=UPI0033FC7F70